MKKFLASFGYALRGIFTTLVQERNMRIHFAFSLLVVFFGFVCRISSLEWLAALIFIGSVFTAEAHNTAIELTLDRVGKEKNELTKRAKDAAAGGVLIAATVAAIGGGVIFFRASRIELALEFFRLRPWSIPLFAIAVILLLIFIIRHKKER